MLGVSLRPPPEAFTPFAESLHPKLTTRERVILQTKPTSCLSCHGVINPLGFSLEQFDAVGRYRDKENERLIDATGSYETRKGETVKFTGARELAKFLAGSEEVHSAFAEQLFQHLVKQPVRAYGPRQLADLRDSRRMWFTTIKGFFVFLVFFAVLASIPSVTFAAVEGKMLAVIGGAVAALGIAFLVRERIGVDRDEQGRAGIARDRNAIGELHKGVVRARHQHTVFAGSLDPVAQPHREIEHDILLAFAVRPLGAGIDAAMAGIEHHERPRVGGESQAISLLDEDREQTKPGPAPQLCHRCEGPLEPGCTVAIVDDVVTTGGSSLQAIDAVEAKGCKVALVVAVLDRLEGAAAAFAARGLPFHALLTIRDLGVEPMEGTASRI